MIPLLTPPDESPRARIQRARSLWLACLFLPFVYLGIGFLVSSLLFRSIFPFGFWPMSPKGLRVLFMVFLMLVIVLEAIQLLIYIRFRARILPLRHEMDAISVLTWKRTILMLACADTVSGIGLAAFLLTANWFGLIGFCLLSYLFYLQAYPGGPTFENS